MASANRLSDIVCNMSRESDQKLPSSLNTIICRYYGAGDVLIVFMDRIQIYNLVTPSSIALQPPLGINQHSESTPSSETQNPFTFRCSAVDRGYHSDDVLFIGGFDEEKGVAVSDCRSYSIRSNTLRPLSHCIDPRSDARSVMLSQSECVTMGGHQIEAIDSVELYSVDKDQWQKLPSLPSKNVYFAAASAPKLEKVFVAGGQDSYGVHNTCNVLRKVAEDIDAEPAVNGDGEQMHWQWTALRNMMRYNYWCDGLYVDRYDEFMVVGGLRRNRNVDRYVVVKDEWGRLPPSNYDHYNGVCAVWNGDIVWIGDDRKMSNFELFDRRANQWISRRIEPQWQPPYHRARIWMWI